MNTATKFGTDYQACAHSFAYASKNEQGENYGNRMFFSNDIIYSYGYHFVIAKKIRNKNKGVDFILFNDDNYSPTTSKQQWAVRRALYHDIINCHTNIDDFKPVKEIEQKEIEMFRNANLYSRARADHKKNEFLSNVLQELKDINFLMNYYRVKSKVSQRIKSYLKIEDNDELLKVLGVSENNKAIADKRAQTIKEKKAEARRIEEAKKEVESIKKWKNNEIKRVYLRFTNTDFLRVSKDSLNIETSQGISITTNEAKRLLKLIERKKIIGAKIDDKFIVTAFNGALKVGCHNIPVEEINTIKDLI